MELKEAIAVVAGINCLLGGVASAASIQEGEATELRELVGDVSAVDLNECHSDGHNDTHNDSHVDRH